MVLGNLLMAFTILFMYYFQFIIYLLFYFYFIHLFILSTLQCNFLLLFYWKHQHLCASHRRLSTLLRVSPTGWTRRVSRPFLRLEAQSRSRHSRGRRCSSSPRSLRFSAFSRTTPTLTTRRRTFTLLNKIVHS